MIYKIQRAKLQQALLNLRRKEKLVSRWTARQKATGKTVAGLFKGTKIHPGAYCRWVRGIWEPSDRNVEKVEAVFKKEKV